MLQQTRVEAVKGYYARFLAELPTVQALAQCDDEKLHKLWEGLGYYSRVRNLKKAAQVIVSQYGGAFPQTYQELLALPGIGEYTAGAIGSIAFNLPTPAVDGNVLRVCARLTEDCSPIDFPETKKKVHAALAAIYPENAGDFTQALMELGATLCGPNWKPRCGSCPCSHLCRAYQAGTAEDLPVAETDVQSIAALYTATLVGLLQSWLHYGMKHDEERFVERVARLTDGTMRRALERSCGEETP